MIAVYSMLRLPLSALRSVKSRHRGRTANDRTAGDMQSSSGRSRARRRVLPHGRRCGMRSGGESGIRTHVRVSPKHAFQACAFNHSAISPWVENAGRIQRGGSRQACFNTITKPDLTGSLQFSIGVSLYRHMTCPVSDSGFPRMLTLCARSPILPRQLPENSRHRRWPSECIR
jgi:hypothetical protein